MKPANILGYQFGSFHKAFNFQITEQSEELTDFVRDCGYYRASNGWDICSRAHPEIHLSSKTIFLRGENEEEDYRIQTVSDVDASVVSRVDFQVKVALKELVTSFKTAQKYRGCYDDEIEFDDGYYNRRGSRSVRLPKFKGSGSPQVIIINNR